MNRHVVEFKTFEEHDLAVRLVEKHFHSIYYDVSYSDKLILFDDPCAFETFLAVLDADQNITGYTVLPS